MHIKDLIGCITGVSGLSVSLFVLARSIAAEKKKYISELRQKKRLTISSLSSLQSSTLTAQREMYSLQTQAEDQKDKEIADMARLEIESYLKQEDFIKSAFDELKKDIPNKADEMDELDKKLESILATIAAEGAALQVKGSNFIDPAKRHLDLSRRAREQGIVLPAENPL